MTDMLEMNVAARVMLLATSLGIKDARRLWIYERAVLDAVRCRLCCTDSFEQAVEQVLAQELDKLEAAVRARQADSGAATSPEKPVRERPQKDPTGYMPEVKPLQQKLEEARKPVQKLILDDCVSMGLVKPDEAERLALNMTGKHSQDAELEVVDKLRAALQAQVRKFLRRAKDCPLANPLAQEELREDIARVKTVGSLVMLSRQINREQARWEEQRPRGRFKGLLGNLRF